MVCRTGPCQEDLPKLPPSTLFRLEQGQQSLTLGRLSQLMKRHKAKLADIFPGR